MKIFCRIFLLLTFSVSAFATDNKLHQLQTRIQNLTSSLQNAHSQQNQLQQELKAIETKSGNLAVALQKTQQQLAQQQSQLHTINKKQDQKQNQLQSQRHALAQQIRNIYIQGQQPYLKLLLNQEDPMQMGRMITYFHYINQQRLTLMQQYQQTLTKLDRSKHITQKQTQQLQQLQQQLQKQQTEIDNTKLQRQQLLQVLNTQIQSKSQQLSVLMANKEALEKVLNQLAKKRSRLTTTIFIPKNGKLPWPTHGKIIEHFGAPIEQSQLKTSGVLIAAPQGQNVYAIASGQVAYANWMTGYGLLLIIDHGNGFMTIYGRNNSLYKKVGDQVKAGDLIATVGNTGGYAQTALYFALRHSGKAIDPAQWCA